MPGWRIAIGSDNAGCEYKSILISDLEKDSRVEKVIDVGVNKGEEDFDTAYPHIGVKAARLVSQGEADRALLICGTGMGVAISANKVVSPCSLCFWFLPAIGLFLLLVSLFALTLTAKGISADV